MPLSVPGIVVGTLGAGLALALPLEYGILALLLVLQMPWAADLAGSSGAAIRPVDAVMAAWGLRLLIAARCGRLNLQLLRSTPVLLWGAWILWLVTATIGANVRDGDFHRGAQLVSAVRLLQMALLMPIGAVTLSTAPPERVRQLLTVVTGMALFQAAISFTRWAPDVFLDVDWVGMLRLPLDPDWITGRDRLLAYALERRGRWTGSFGDPATFGYFMLAGLAAVWAHPGPGRRRFRVAVAAIVVLAALSSLTRTVWIGLGLMSVVAWVTAPPWRDEASPRRTRLAGLAAGAAVWLTLLGAHRVVVNLTETPRTVSTTSSPTDIVPTSTAVRPLSPADTTPASPRAIRSAVPSRPPPPAWSFLLRLEFDESLAGRLTMMRSSLEQFAVHPIIGIGWSGRRFHGETVPWGEPLYVRLLAETGLVGLVLFLAFLTSCLRSALECFHQPSSDRSTTAMFGLLGLSAFVGVLAGDLLIVGPSLTSALLFFLAGAAAARRRPEAAGAYPPISRTPA